jgi:hypothetical protein
MKRLLLILVLLFAPAAFAQDNKDEGWQKVDGSMMAQGETIPASKLVGAAYGFIWVALLVWVASVAARTRRVEEEIESLRQKLKK